MESDGTGAHANIELIRSAFAAFNNANLDTCTQFLTDDFVINLAGMPYQMRGRDAWIQNAQVMQSAFPGIQARIDDVFSADAGPRRPARSQRWPAMMTNTGAGEGTGLALSSVPVAALAAAAASATS
jgi:hypothetical protein